MARVVAMREDKPTAPSATGAHRIGERPGYDPNSPRPPRRDGGIHKE